MQFTLAEIAELVAGRLAGDGSRTVSGIAPLEEAGTDTLTFVTDAAYLNRFLQVEDACAILPMGLEAPGRDVIHHTNPRSAIALLLTKMYPEEVSEIGVHPTASVDPTAVLGEDVSIGAFAQIGPRVELGDFVVVRSNAVVRADCHLGAHTKIHEGVVLYPRVRMGRDCRIHSNSVIGADGFGYTEGGATHQKIPHVGGVVIGDRVEIGSNSCIDGGMLGPTCIGDDTKIDNLVQVGHNCRIGKRVLLCGQVGIAGSCDIGDDCVMAGQVGMKDHVTFGRRSMAGAAASVLGNFPEGSMVGGTPAHDFKAWRRESKALQSLPALLKEMRTLRKRVAELEAKQD